jgi:hypothetical protein
VEHLAILEAGGGILTFIMGFHSVCGTPVSKGVQDQRRGVRTNFEANSE